MAASRTKRKRHWTPWEIGSDSWWKALRQLGVSRAAVKEILASQPEPIDPHDLPCGLEPAARLALLFLVAWRDPSYAAFMYVPHVWGESGRAVKEWLACQYVAFIRTGGERRKQALYSLWVDYFEVDERARFVYPRLVRQLELDEQRELLGHSGPVPWDAKKEHYERAAADPAQHEALAAGLLGSFTDVFGRVDAPEAKRLLDRLQVHNEEIRQRLAEMTEQAAHWRVDAVITVDRKDERWLRWIPAGRRNEPSFLAVMTQLDGSKAWIARSEVWLGDELLGRLVHSRFPFDAKIAHQVRVNTAEDVGSIDSSSTGASRMHAGSVVEASNTYGATNLFRVEGSADDFARAVGRVVEVWPQGLRPKREA